MAKKKTVKKDILLFLGAILIGIGIFVLIQSFLESREYNGFHKKVETISYTKYEELISSDEDFILIYGANSCPACQTYKSTYATALESLDAKTYYIDADVYSEKQKTEIVSYYGIEGTPHTLVFIDGELQNSIGGAQNLTNTKQLIQDFLSLVN